MIDELHPKQTEEDLQKDQIGEVLLKLKDLFLGLPWCKQTRKLLIYVADVEMSIRFEEYDLDSFHVISSDDTTYGILDIWFDFSTKKLGHVRGT